MKKQGPIRSVPRQDSLHGSGDVYLRTFWKDEHGNRQYSDFHKSNLIVEAGRSSLIDLLIGAEAKSLSYIRWGKGGAKKYPDGDPLNPLPVDDKDTNVQNELLDKELNPFNRISPTTVEYVETIICDEVDDDVNEAAMLFRHHDTNERSIFSRVTFPTVRLTIEQGTGLEIRWVYNFSKAEEIDTGYDEDTTPSNPDETPPNEVANLAATHTGTTVSLNWENPADADFAYVNVYRNGVLADQQIADNSWNDTGRNYSTTYNYRVTTVDMNENESAGKEISVTTNAS